MNTIPKLNINLQSELSIEVEFKDNDTLEVRIKNGNTGEEKWSVSNKFNLYEEPIMFSTEHLPEYHKDGIFSDKHYLEIDGLPYDTISDYDREIIETSFAGVLSGINLVLFTKYKKFFSITEIINFIVEFYKGVDNIG